MLGLLDFGSLARVLSQLGGVLVQRAHNLLLPHKAAR